MKRTVKQLSEMMEHFQKHRGMKVSMWKTIDRPMVVISTTYGAYPAVVLSPTRPVTDPVKMRALLGDQYYIVEHNGVQLETYERYCCGAKERKVTTPKYLCDNGTWMRAEDYWAKYGL